MNRTTRQPSLLRRIVVRLSISTLIAIICTYVGWWWQLEPDMRDESLIDAARTIARAVRVDTSGQLVLNLSAEQIQDYSVPQGEKGFSVRDRDSGKVLFAAGAITGPIPSGVDDDLNGALYRNKINAGTSDSHIFFGEAFPFTINDRRLVVQVVQLKDNLELIRTVLVGAIDDGKWEAGPLLLILLLVSIVTVRRTLAPLRELSQRAEAINPQATDLRLPHDGVPIEILPLVTAVNSALDRLDKGFHTQREFTADAAHELRTPLAVLAAHIDTLPDRETAASLRRDLDTMSHLVEQLLRAAHVESLVVDPEDSADLCTIAREVAAYLAPVAIREDLALEVDAPETPVYVNGRTEALFHAVRNLVDNALRHTQPGTAVILTVSASPPTLAVRDHGPGVPADVQDKIFQRFWRSDRRTGGAGLGLSIVARTMKAHGGRITVHDAESGGAVFSMEFPTGNASEAQAFL